MASSTGGLSFSGSLGGTDSFETPGLSRVRREAPGTRNARSRSW
jgi:hypothetical protein